MIAAILIIRLICFVGLFASVYLAFVAHQYLLAFLLYYCSGIVFIMFEFFRPEFELYSYRIHLTTGTLLFYSFIWIMPAFWVVVHKVKILFSGKRYVVWGHEGSTMHYFSKWEEALIFAKEKQVLTKCMFIQDLLRHTFIDGKVDNPMWFITVEDGMGAPSKWGMFRPHPLIYVATLLVNSINISDNGKI